ncbi:hypothetical protein ASE95_11870 [Sphingomonas sp. Leaf231]|uniref:DUF6528 family protein n=1 Tax=Sphingomonas sp. Leaf231 TaxID=1736301 RepID=UPI0006F817AC|nr:DUF6528 family protein [Sphingomonas sp. Leaf231]KQN90963.1 hypothetical protein ASE95_11870 [Sphingomonas sp. Leaf231]
MSTMIRMAAASLAMATPGSAQAAERLYACGDDQVREYDVDPASDAGPHATEIWRWSAATAADLPAAYRTRLLARIDECKPIDEGRAILITASTGGVAVVDRASGRVSFRATAPMAHSAAVVPGGRIAMALSLHAQGDRLQLYDRNRGGTPLLSRPLPSGHGAVWDEQHRRLFVLSHDLIQAYKAGGERGASHLTETSRWTLPGRRDGHDLSRRADGGYLVTTDDGVWTFDPRKGSFVPFAALNPKLKVKSVDMHGHLAWVQAEESWWAKGFTIARADGGDPVRVPVEGMHLYKVRWVR